jgi:hypothetical protein
LTWAFASRKLGPATFDSLPRTTFLNVEAVAVEVWPERGHGRHVFENKFFKAVLSRTLEINGAKNPFPELAVVRSLSTAVRLDFGIGYNLTKFTCSHSASMTAAEIERVQIGHYGKMRCDGNLKRDWIEHLLVSETTTATAVRLPAKPPLQLSFVARLESCLLRAHARPRLGSLSRPDKQH